MNRRTLALVAGGTIALSLAGLVAAGAIMHTTRNERARGLDADLRRELAAYHAQRWERPVLRGAPLDGNAAEEQARVIASLGALPEAEDAAAGKALRAGEGMPDEVLSLARKHRAALDDLRASAQRPWAWTRVDVERGPAAPLPSFVPFRRARRLLLALATDAEPGECLRIAADTIRLSQDMAAGTGLVGLMLTTVDVEAATPVILRCAARAGAEARAEAARELGVLVAHPAPVGSSFEHEVLMMASGIVPLAVDVPLVPTSGDAFERWISRVHVLGAAELFLGDLPSMRRLDARRYPEGFTWVQSTTAARASSSNPLVSIATTDYIKYLHKHAAAEARLRAATAVVEALASEAKTGAPAADPTPILARPALADPFAGAPLRWKIRDGKLAVWSVGPDQTDAGGAGDDVGAQAP